MDTYNLKKSVRVHASSTMPFRHKAQSTVREGVLLLVEDGMAGLLIPQPWVSQLSSATYELRRIAGGIYGAA